MQAFRLGLRREGLPEIGGVRIVQTRAGLRLDPIFVGYQFVGFAQHRRPRLEVVCVGSEKVHPVPPQKLVGDALRHLAKAAGQRGSGDLH